MSAIVANAQGRKNYDAIYSGVPWFNDHGKVVSAHGANIVNEKGKYYLFGEAHSDTSNAFAGINCYSSADLYNWKFEGEALAVQDGGRLGRARVGERPKVLKCKTGEYVMLIHTDDLHYNDACVGYATSSNISGPYVFRGPLLFNGSPIKKWDIGTFQDSDGSAYLLIHGGVLYKLANDYKSVAELVVDNDWRGAEAPAMFKKDGTYFWLVSDLTGWERNDNFYYTATSLKGPWTLRGTFAPKGKLTWNSQTSFVLPVIGSKDTTFMFIGDRWSSPKQASAATYVWQPLNISGTTLSIPEYKEAWRINPAGRVRTKNTVKEMIIANGNKNSLSYSGHWNADTLGVRSAFSTKDSLIIRYKGAQAFLYGLSRPDGGYAYVNIYNSKGQLVISGTIDTYCKYYVKTLSFLSPKLPNDSYTLTMSALGQHWSWIEKSGRRTGSKGNLISFDHLIVTN